LPEGTLRPALSFALLAELCAIGSLALSGLALGYLLDPELTHLLLTPRALGWAVGGTFVLSASMVLLHAAWGVFLELGLSRSGASPKYLQGVRFGLYACGWDLLTSPAGIAQGLLSRGFFGAWGPIRAAVAVPRSALHAYVSECRKLDSAAERQGLSFSFAILIVSLAGLVGIVVLGLLSWLW
jgi:hypothetical protein